MVCGGLHKRQDQIHCQVPTEVYIQELDRNIASSSGDWLDSWKDAWTPIGSTAGNTNGTSGPGGTNGTSSPAPGTSWAGLSVGARASIGTGIAIVVLAVVLLAFFLIRRWMRKDAPPRPTRKRADGFSWNDGRGSAGFVPREMEGRETRDPVEIGPPGGELKGRMSRGRYELVDI